MDTIDIIKLLTVTFGSSILCHPKFKNDFNQLIVNTCEYEQIIKKVFEKINAMQELGNIDHGPPWLEHLKAYGNMYSLHIKTKTGNYRILFSNHAKSKCFLHIFNEKSGKRATSYKKHIPIAVRRRDEF